jgi:hypothetical protein
MKDFDWRVRDGFKPTRSFEEGEDVEFGNHTHSVVRKALEGGMYVVYSSGMKNNYGTQVPYTQETTVAWHELYKIREDLPKTSLKQPIRFRMNQSNRNIEGLLRMVVGDYAGVDFTPEYQREYVWTLEDKQKLIDSIFNNVTIGLFVFAKVSYEVNGKGYEVIDGKQRLTALIEFYEDRFQYKGYYFSELSRSDKYHFEDYGVSMGTLEEPSEKEKYAAFLAVNTFGKVMDEKHLQTVREKYEQL